MSTMYIRKARSRYRSVYTTPREIPGSYVHTHEHRKRKLLAGRSHILDDFSRRKQAPAACRSLRGQQAQASRLTGDATARAKGRGASITLKRFRYIYITKLQRKVEKTSFRLVSIRTGGPTAEQAAAPAQPLTRKRERERTFLPHLSCTSH